ncbi:hypothetical protein Nepgr_026287 [Nepenthes gracilis]|uniref:Uncharacterized protein n=1 Tax=Nepenthes gracilis TaxID=150966 RepID=A0AAD3T828_NEPGR|nr:hypothetical protein Nepgr_026287 [Nepenthes gracilis]
MAALGFPYGIPRMNFENSRDGLDHWPRIGLLPGLLQILGMCPADVAHLLGMADDCSLLGLVLLPVWCHADMVHLPGMDEFRDWHAVSCLAGMEFGCLVGLPCYSFCRITPNDDLPKFRYAFCPD